MILKRFFFIKLKVKSLKSIFTLLLVTFPTFCYVFSVFILLSFAFFLGTKLPLYCFDLSYFVCCQRWVRWLYSECWLEGRWPEMGFRVPGMVVKGRFSRGFGFSVCGWPIPWSEIVWEPLWVSLLPGFISWQGNRGKRKMDLRL